MKNFSRKNNIVRPMLRAIVLVTLMVGPFAGFAAAASNDIGRDLSGAGFVLYMAMIR